MKRKKAKHRKKEPLWLGLGVVALTASIALIYFLNQPPSFLIAQPTPETIQMGARLFEQNCAVCHGPSGRGENPNRPKGGMKEDGGYLAPALNGTGLLCAKPF